MLRRPLLAVLVLVLMAGFAYGDDDRRQADRKAFIQNLFDLGFVTEIEVIGDNPPTPHVWLHPKFNKQYTFEEKEAFLIVVYSYYRILDSRMSKLVLKDAMTGKQIGYVLDGALRLK